MEVRIYATDGLAQRKQLEAHERRQLLGALKVSRLLHRFCDASN